MSIVAAATQIIQTIELLLSSPTETQHDEKQFGGKQYLDYL
jgi:hypothetical protein